MTELGVRSVVAVGLAGALALGGGFAHAQLRGAIRPAGETTAPATAAAPAPGPKPAAPAPPPPPAEDPFLVFYPAAAKAAGVEGQATISCRRNEHLAVVGCTLVSESPAGQGFGQSALAMAAQAKDNPKISIAELKAAVAQSITIRFMLHPPGISPDLTRPAHVFANPEIVTKPTDAQIQAAYPARALADQIQGGAAIDCIVTETGRLSGCRVATETPSGYGFGEAALDLATDFVMRPGELDNQAVGGRPVRISVAFTPNDAGAPLTLDTKPPP